MRSKHSSDERLIALMDGELSVVARLQTRAHLRSCWECRARLARLEGAAQALAEAGRGSRFLPSERVDIARTRFETQIRRATPVAEERRSFLHLAGRRGFAFGFAAMLSVAAVVTVWQRSETPVVQTPVVRRSAKPEHRGGIGPAMQEQPRTRVSEAPLPVVVAPVMTASPELELEREVAVLWVIHESSSCRGQDVRVDKGPERLRIRGILDTPQKREVLRSRLQALDFEVDVELSDAAEAIAVASTNSTPQELLQTERVTRAPAPGEAMIREWLEQQKLSSSQNVAAKTAEIANASVRSADLAWVEAWALQDLRTRFGKTWHQLPDSSRLVVLSMMRDHWSELQMLAARQRQAMGGVLGPTPPSNLDVLESVQKWNLAVQQLFASAEPVAVPASALANQISASLARVEAIAGDDLSLTALVRSGAKSEHVQSVAPQTP